MPLRKLFKSIPELLLTLKPCLMMSPLSVSYFLEAESYNFDIVIFDEASQIDYDDKSAKYPSYIPKIGDIIYMYYNGIYYEVINVKEI